MKTVAVSQRVDFSDDRQEVFDALDHRVTRFLMASGFVSVPVPNIGKAKHVNCFLERVNPFAFFLSGGNDIGQCRERDETEFAMIDYAKLKRLPLLGICRGMQIMAYKGGVNPTHTVGHVGTRHKIRGEISGIVNSYHNYCVSVCPKNYRVTSRSEENLIESIKHNDLPWEGWMWHPEREPSFAKCDVERLKLLFNH